MRALHHPMMTYEPKPNFLIAERPRRFPIDELDEVTLSSDVESDAGAIVPAGATGTVVAVWGDAEAYEVEFSEPFHALATVASRATGGEGPIPGPDGAGIPLRSV